MMLAKRAFSSAHSLLRSLERRMAGLEDDLDAPSQPALPFECDIDDSDEPLLPRGPAFDRADAERAVLQRLVHAARLAAKDERKLHALRRIVRRIHEPLIVFTEYRDTLHAIASAVGALRRVTLLHGGLTPQERRESIAAFTTGEADLLLATDAGSRGAEPFNIGVGRSSTSSSRNPIRPEQRIGRVDRIGQTRTVHAINLFAEGTAEGEVLAGLLRRLDQIRMSEIELAACVIDRCEPAPRPSVEPLNTIAVDMRAAATDEAHRLAGARHVAMGEVATPADLVPVTVVELRRPGHFIAFMRVRLVTGAGRLLEDVLVPIGVPFGMQRRLGSRDVRATAEALVAALRPALVRTARQHAYAREKTIARESAEWAARAIERERRIGEQAAATDVLPVQAGLFDSRALKQRADRRRHGDAVRRDSDARRTRLEGDVRVSLPHDPDIAAPLHMLTGMSGSLVSHHFAERILHEEFAGRLGEASLGATHQSLTRWLHSASTQLGPASSVRAIWDVTAAPIAEHLGFVVGPPGGENDGTSTPSCTRQAAVSCCSPQRGTSRSTACGVRQSAAVSV
jgi:hypothetical protein